MKGGEFDMAGNILTDQKCNCGKTFKHDPARRGCFCPAHPDQAATRYIVKIGNGKPPNGARKRVTNYTKAEALLGGWRFERWKGTFDPRDYMASEPLGVINLGLQYLERKRVRVGDKHYRNIKNDMYKVMEHFGNVNIKTIGYGELEDFLHPSKNSVVTSGLSSKSRFNLRSTISDFYKWLVRRRILKRHEVPELPEVPFKLGYRNTITRETQDQIVDKVVELTRDFNPRIWIAINFLLTYVNVRPGELIQIKEGDIDLDRKRITLRRETTKEGHEKYIFLIDEDVEFLRTIPKGFSNLPFFRHLKGNGAAKPGQQFGHDYLYKWWKKACKELGIEGVDLYGGTRHSTVIHLREQGFSPEEVKRASMHSTNKAFERYLQITANELTPIYGATRKRKTPTKLVGGPQVDLKIALLGPT